MKEKKTLLIYVPSLMGGGAERAALNIANSFAHYGHRVYFVVATNQGVYWDLISDKVNVVRLGRSSAALGLGALRHQIEELRPDACLATLKSAVVSLLVCRAWLGARSPAVIMEQNVFTPPETLSGRIYKRLQQKLYPKADMLIANSSDTLQSLADASIEAPESTALVGNPVFSMEIVDRSKEDVAHRWFEDRGDRLFIAIGRLVPQKGFDYLLDAISKLKERGFEARCIILGEGPLREELTEQARRLGILDQVDMPGFVNNPYAFLRRADAFVLSSRWEGFGNVIVEALAMDTPVVSARCPGGPVEILDNGRWGRLVEPDDPEALAIGMAAELVCPEGEKLSGRAAQYDIDAVGMAYLEALERLPAPEY